MDELNEHADDLFWHAPNYRTAATQHADAMWLELQACVDRKAAAERKRCYEIVQTNQCRNGFHDHDGERIGHFHVRMFDEICNPNPIVMDEPKDK